MRSALMCGFIIAGLLMPSSSVRAAAWADPATAPPGTQNVSGKMKVHIEEVSGMVRVRASGDAPWQKAVVGMIVDEGAEFQTGNKSFVRCSIPPDQQFVLDRLGTVKVLQAIRDGDKVKTDMVMKYGRTKYAIEAAGLDHELTVASPSATLAVRGTDFTFYDQPPFNYSVNTDHVIRVRDSRRQLSIGSNKTTAKVKLDGNQRSAADTALASSVTDPRYGMARTQAENVYIAQQVSRGGVVSFDPLANILVVRNSNPITSDAQLAKVVPGPLTFTLRWNANSDVNLSVFSQFGDPNAILLSGGTFTAKEYLYPGYGLNVSKAGGTIPFDDRGGPRGGTELAYYKSVLTGVYGLVATLISGGPTDIKLNAFVYGQRQAVFATDAQDNFVKALTLNLTLTKVGETQTALVFVPAVPLLENSTPDQGTVTPGTAAPAKKSSKSSPAPAIAQRAVSPAPVPTPIPTPKPAAITGARHR